MFRRVVNTATVWATIGNVFLLIAAGITVGQLQQYSSLLQCMLVKPPNEDNNAVFFNERGRRMHQSQRSHGTQHARAAERSSPTRKHTNKLHQVNDFWKSKGLSSIDTCRNYRM